MEATMNADGRILAAVGLPPEAEPSKPTLRDATQFLVEQVTESLDRNTPAEFLEGDDYPLSRNVQAWANAYIADPSQAKSLVMVGGTGTGKTYNAWKALRAVVIGCYGRNVRLQWEAVEHTDFTTETRPAPNDAHVTTLRRYQETGLLFFDDLGSALKATEWSEEMLFALVNHRWKNRLPTIWTTNVMNVGLDPSKPSTRPGLGPTLRQRIGDRSLSRIWASQKVVFDGPDLRRAGV
jgi:DNA replication protein DnaC